MYFTETLSEAKEKAKKAKITSDLSSTEEKTPIRKKRISKNSCNDIINSKKKYVSPPIYNTILQNDANTIIEKSGEYTSDYILLSVVNYYF